MKTDFNFNEQLYLFLAIIHFYITNDIALLSTFKVQIQDMTNMTHTMKTENRQATRISLMSQEKSDTMKIENRQATRISLMSQEKSDTTNIDETREEMSQILKCSILLYHTFVIIRWT